MFRKFILISSAAVMTAAPVVAHAAPARTATPVASEAEGMTGSGPFLGVVFFLVGAGLIALLWHDGDDLPTSP